MRTSLPVIIELPGWNRVFKTADNLPLGVTSDYDYEEQECYLLRVLSCFVQMGCRKLKMNDQIFIR